MPAAETAPGAPRLLALTGATGFVGSHLVEHFTAQGWRVRVLARRWPPPNGIAEAASVEIVEGTLEDEAAIRRLLDGADAVIHAAGLIKARDPRALFHVNETLARRFAEAARTIAPAAPFLLLSSMAAREPQLSAYAASKRAGEDAVVSALAETGQTPRVLRPPAVYGPGDRETLRLFAMAKRGRILTPAQPHARLGFIAVSDLARAAQALLEILPQAPGPSAFIGECDDGRAEGYGWNELPALAGAALGHHVVAFRVPSWALLAAGAAGSFLHRFGLGDPQLSLGKAREILHADWRGDNTLLTRLTGWRPQLSAARGFAETVAWYRRNNWL
jgi:nucleoside-diphosphate-sugar epimerase